MSKWYYIIFIGVLYFFSQTFQEYVLAYGLFEAVIVGLIVAFVCKFLFKMVTRTIIFIVVIAGILTFLVSSGMIELPFNLMVMSGLFL